MICHILYENLLSRGSANPNLDHLTSNGCLGSVISVGKGIAPQSDIAVFNMLGYDFKDVGYPGRGIIEALGMGMEFRDGDLVLRGNFATIDDQGNITDRRAGRDIEYEIALEVCRTLESLKFTQYQRHIATKHRASSNR